MSLVSCISRRSRARKRGRSFNAARNVLIKAVGAATCTNYGVCPGRLETETGATDSLTAAKKFSSNFNNVSNPVQFLEIVVKNTAIPPAYLQAQNVVLPYSGLQYKPPTGAGDWVAFPSTFLVWARRRVGRWWHRWYRWRYMLFIGLVPGSTAAEATYRIFVHSFWYTRYAGSTQARQFMSKTLTEARDFRGLSSSWYGGHTPIGSILDKNPTASYVVGAFHPYPSRGWVGRSGFIKVTVPGLEDSASVIYDMR